jgi:hypothetical protein
MALPPTYTLEQLTEARAAYHRLMTGTSAVEVTDQNGDKAVFNRIDSNKLYAYIQRMEAQLYPCSPAAITGPAGFFF